MLSSLTRRAPGMLTTLYRGALSLSNTSPMLQRPRHFQHFEDKKRKTKSAKSGDVLLDTKERVRLITADFADARKAWKEAEEGSPEKDLFLRI